MLGAIIGDIVGSRWEFNSTNDYNFEWLSDQNGFTDDTICTVAVADALLQGRDFGESIHEWCNRYPHPNGVTAIHIRWEVMVADLHNGFGVIIPSRITHLAMGLQ